MRNFVAKNDFNRAATHKTAKDYSRASVRDLMLEAQNNLDELQWEEECAWMDAEEWEVTNEKTYS